jgi:hypothetical protein
VTPLIENLQAKGLDAQRAAPARLQDAVRQAFEKRFPGIDRLLEYYSPPDFYLNEDVIRERKLSRENVERAAITALLDTGLVAKVYTHDDLRSARSPSDADPFLTLFKNGFYEPRSPQLTVLLKQHVYLSSLAGGTGHGTAYDDDRHVPIVFMGPRIRPGFYTEPSGPEDIAPTLAQILGLTLPRERDSRLLVEMLSGN